MLVVFLPERVWGKVEMNQEMLQRLMDENDQLIRFIVEYQNKGRAVKYMQLQHTLCRNLIYLAMIADAPASSNTKKAAADSRSTRPCSWAQFLPLV
ncbi:SS18-like protein 2 [Anolis carolinensis]|uniref:SS18-like protein 2 n=1 Tax=Anolis carolinensis TaxID=28377 RepID=UPI002F2B4459